MDPKSKKIVEKFDINNKRFLDDCKRAYNNLNELLDRKQKTTTALLGLNMPDRAQYEKQARGLLKELDKTIRVEEKYLSRLYSSFSAFRKQADYILQFCVKRDDILFRSVPNFKNLTQRYMEELLELCKEIDQVLQDEIQINKEELRHIRRSEGNIFTRDFMANYVKEFNRFRQSTMRENDIQRKVDELAKMQKGLEVLGSNIRHDWDALNPDLKTMIKTGGGILLIGAVVVNPLPLIGAGVALCGLFLARRLKA